MTKICRICSSLILFAIVVLLAFMSSSDAAMKEVSLEQLADQSDVIIGGQVLSMNSYWNSDKTLIFTTVIVGVNESLKGMISPEDTISIMIPGGEVDGVGLGVEHAPRFEIGEETIVFLRLIEEGRYAVTGWEQGKFTIMDDLIKSRKESLEDFKDQIRATIEKTPESEEEE